MDKLDNAILTLLADQVFTPERVMAMLTELRSQIEVCQKNDQDEIGQFQKELAELDKATARCMRRSRKACCRLTRPCRRAARD